MMRLANAKPIIAIMLVLALIGATSFAGTADLLDQRPSLSEEGEPTGGEMLLDVALVRPMSFVGLVVGCTTWLIAAPFALMADGTDGIEKISRPLVVEPAKYTFKRPVGEL